MENNGKLWDVIAEYAHCVGEYMHSTPKYIVEDAKKLKKAQADLIDVIGERQDSVDSNLKETK